MTCEVTILRVCVGCGVTMSVCVCVACGVTMCLCVCVWRVGVTGLWGDFFVCVVCGSDCVWHMG